MVSIKFIVGITFSVLILCGLYYGHQNFLKFNAHLSQLQHSTDESIAALRFSEELYHTQLELWEYAHLSSRERKEAFYKRVQTLDLRAKEFFEFYDSEENLLEYDLNQLKLAYETLKTLGLRASKNSKTIIDKSIVVTEAYNDKNQFMNRIEHIIKSETLKLTRLQDEMIILFKNIQQIVLFICVFFIVVTIIFISFYQAIKYQKIVSDLENKRREQFTKVSKMASLGEMMGGLAHEINNPVTIIQGKSNQLLRHLHSGDFTLEIGIEQLQKIVLMTDRIVKIVSALNSFSRNADNDPTAIYSLDSMILNAISLCSERFNHHKIKLEVNNVHQLLIECRSVQIEQVLINLLNNAYDAVLPLAEKWVRVDGKVLGENIQISITDSGKGIAPHVVEKLMQPFFTTKEVGKGTGLGLSISNGILEQHQGSLHYVSSSVNTCFVVELPIKQTQVRMKAV